MKEVNELAVHSKVVEGFKNFNPYFANKKVPLFISLSDEHFSTFSFIYNCLIQYHKLHNQSLFIEALVILKRLLTSPMGTSSIRFYKKLIKLRIW